MIVALAWIVLALSIISMCVSLAVDDEGSGKRAVAFMILLPLLGRVIGWW